MDRAFESNKSSKHLLSSQQYLIKSCGKKHCYLLILQQLIVSEEYEIRLKKVHAAKSWVQVFETHEI